MRLPNAGHAIIDDLKIGGYLLSPSHPRGAAKAQFFARFGLTLQNEGLFRRALLDHASQNPVSRTEATPYGTVFEVNGRLATPDGRNPWVIVVWFIATGAAVPRLVTAIPSKGPSP